MRRVETQTGGVVWQERSVSEIRAFKRFEKKAIFSWTKPALLRSGGSQQIPQR